jgi:phosphosulfolactate synthase (CoM biosynthesis protein A)
VSNDIRDLLFSSGVLEKITNKECRELLKKAKVEGISVISEAVNKISKENLVLTQNGYAKSIVKSVKQYIEASQKRFYRQGNSKNNGLHELEKQVEFYEPEARTKCLSYYDALERARAILEEAL